MRRGSRGGQSITAGSGGSKASVRPSAAAVAMLIHRICAGVIGSTMPKAIAAMMTSDSVPFVGRFQAITFLMLPEIVRPSRTAATMVAKLSSASTTRAASLAASVPFSPIATPTSARFRAGASLTPSPVIATTRPSACSASIRRSLCSGAARAKTSTPGARARSLEASIAAIPPRSGRRRSYPAPVPRRSPAPSARGRR